MDFLDPKKVRHHTIMLFVGYLLIAVAIVSAATILLYQSSGYGINKKGEVIQNALVFAASTPEGGKVYIDGKDSTFVTNKRLVLVAGNYVLQYRKDGYYTWARSIQIEGGKVYRYDYSYLIPKKLDTTTVANLDTTPLLTTQSPDRRWFIIQSTTNSRQFTVYDLKNVADAPVQLTVPATVITSTDGTWELAEWSNDNVHILLRHTTAAGSEYVLVNREDATQSVNLSATLPVKPTEIRLKDKKYNQYYLFDKTAATLQTATLSQPQPLAFLNHVLAFKPYGAKQMLYVTDDTQQKTATDTQVAVKLLDDNQTYTIRKMAAGNQYLLEMAGYSGDLFVAAGSDTENKVVVYKNPIDSIKNKDIGVAVQSATLKINAPNYLSFSNSTRYIMTENANSFSIYDAEEDKSYTYTLKEQFDAPQTHASWMDGDRLTYVSSGKLLVFEADQYNRHLLFPMNAAYQPAFTPDYKQVFSISPRADDGTSLRIARTWLKATADR